MMALRWGLGIGLPVAGLGYLRLDSVRKENEARGIEQRAVNAFLLKDFTPDGPEKRELEMIADEFYGKRFANFSGRALHRRLQQELDPEHQSALNLLIPPTEGYEYTLRHLDCNKNNSDSKPALVNCLVMRDLLSNELIVENEKAKEEKANIDQSIEETFSHLSVAELNAVYEQYLDIESDSEREDNISESERYSRNINHTDCKGNWENFAAHRVCFELREMLRKKIKNKDT